MFDNSGEKSVDISVQVRHQACDKFQCFLPKSRELTLTIPLAKTVIPDFEEMKRPSATTVNMDSVKHRKVLSARQSSKESAKKD